MLSGNDAHTGDLVLAFEQTDRRHFTVARKHAVGLRQLKQTGRQTVAVTHGRLLHRPPALIGTQSAGDSAGERHLRLLAETDLCVHLPHVLGRHAHGDFDGAYVAGLLNHLGHAQRSVRVRVGDGHTVHIQLARRGIN